MRDPKQIRARSSSLLGEFGSSLVETAIIIPVALITATGIFSVGVGLAAAYNTHRIAYEGVSLAGATKMSTGTNTSVGHPKVHARAVELATLQPMMFASTPVINTTFATGPEQEEDDGDDSNDEVEVVGPIKNKYQGNRVTAKVDVNFPTFFQRYNIAIEARYVGPYFVPTPSASGSVDFVNPLPLVDCSGVPGGAAGSPCGYS